MVKTTDNMVSTQRVIILALDGLDPKLTEKWMDAGLLPVFAKLRDTGTFSPLTTTNPPETTSAWAAFATGKNPGKTNVFDFVIRDPRTYTPITGLVMLKKDPAGGPPRPRSARMGDSIWKILGDNGLDSTVLNLPLTWPPEQFNGQLLSGMGTPDITGRGSRASFYNSAISLPEKRFSVWHTAIEVIDGIVDTELYGSEEMIIPLRFEIDVEQKSATVTIKEKSTSMEERVLSNWVDLRFKKDGKEILGMCRFCLLEVEPDVKIYCSPIQIHPQKPHLPITTPPEFSSSLYEAIGPYRTQGREVDIFNLQEEIIEDDVLLKDTFLAMEERERMTSHFINESQKDLLISWFGVVDTTQHGYWRFIDPEHPLYSEQGEKMYGDAILKVYQWLDGMVGRILDDLEEGTVLIIASDHGCTDWRRNVDFNGWLMQEGFLFLKPESEDQSIQDTALARLAENSVPLTQVDWTRTKAYSVGCGKIYLNLRGREGQGIVNPGSEAQEIEDEIIKGFKAWRDPENGNEVVSNVYRSRDVQWGPYMNRAPELIVGLQGGYRVSFASLGTISLGEPIEDNNNKISGDHISVDYELVPGTILSNVSFDLESRIPHIVDIAPTVLEYLGIEVPPDMDGQSLWR